VDYYAVKKAIDYATEKFDGLELEKPVLQHSIRVGLKLMDDGFAEKIVVAAILHDLVEDTPVTIEEIAEKFGADVAVLVSAVTKDPKIKSKSQQREELVRRSCEVGRDAIIIKLADVNDNYAYYKKIDNQKGLDYSLELKSYLHNYLGENIHDVYIRNMLIKIGN